MRLPDNYFLNKTIIWQSLFMICQGNFRILQNLELSSVSQQINFNHYFSILLQTRPMKIYHCLLFLLLVTANAFGQSYHIEKRYLELIDLETNPAIKTSHFLMLSSLYTEEFEEDKEKKNLIALTDYLDTNAPYLVAGINEFKRGNHALKTENYKVALQQFNKSLIFFNDQIDEYPEVEHVSAVLTLYCAQTADEAGDYMSATHYFRAGMKIADQLDRKDISSQIDNFLGIIYLDLGDERRSIEYFKKAVEKDISLDVPDMLGYLYYNMSHAYLALGQIDSALVYLEKGVAIDQKFDDNVAQTEFLNLSALIYMDQKKYKESEVALKKALSLKKPYALLESYYYLGHLAIGQNQWNRAKTYLKKVNDSSNLLDPETQIGLFTAMAQIEEKQQNYSKSTNFLNRAITIKDSLLDSRRKNHVSEIDTYFEIKDVREQQLMQAKEKQLIALKLKNRTQQLFLMGLVGLLLLSGGAIVYYQKYLLNKAYKTLVRKNRQLVQVEGSIVDNITDKQNPPLTENIQKEILESLEKSLKVEKIFTDKDISLSKLAENLNTNRSYLSMVINQAHDKNFNFLINEFRILEVLEYFEKNEHHKFTIETLAKKAGFKSKSVFNRCFKEYTGISPSQYLKEFEGNKR